MKFTSTMKRIAELALRQPLEMRGVDPDSPSGKTMIGNSIRSSEGSAGERGISYRTLLLCFWMACQQLDGVDSHVPHTRCEFSAGEPKVSASRRCRVHQPRNLVR